KYEGTHNSLIVAISLSVGVLPMAMPSLLDSIEGPLSLILESGIFLCAIVAVLLNAIINRKTTTENNEETDMDMTETQPAQSAAAKSFSTAPAGTGANDAVSEADLAQLRNAISLAEDSRKRGRHPFASTVVAADGTVLAAEGNNSMPPAGDPTQHAELRAAAEAARKCSPEELAAATLYASAEPCVM